VCEYYNDHLAWEDADPVPVTEGVNTPNINFSLRVEGTISGVVKDPDGDPIVGASLYAGPHTGSGSSGWGQTGPGGAYTIGGLATGDYNVQACATGYVCEYYDNTLDWSAATAVPVTEGGNTADIDFSLREEGTISGTVTDLGGTEIGGASLWACLDGPWKGGGFCSWASTHSNGTYTIGGLATGDYRVGACATGYVCEYYDDHLAWEDADPVPVTEGADTPGINFSLRVEGTISGVVTGPGGGPIVGASLYAEPYTGSGSSGSGQTGPGGAYTVGGLATGEYRVQVCATGYVCEYYDDHLASEDADPVGVTEGVDTPGIDFGLRVEGTISGTVTDAFGTPIGGAAVSAHADAYDGAFFQLTSSQSDGSYVITGLPADSYHVVASRQPFGDSPPWVTEFWEEARWPDEATLVPVVEGADTSDIDFSLELGGSISGVVTDVSGNPIEGADVHDDPCGHQPPWWWSFLSGAETGPDGVYTLPGLATGSYIVWAGAGFYVTEYYDNVPTYEEATCVPVVEGSDTPNIDFSLSAADADGDGVPDSADNCPLVYNPGQENSDSGPPPSGTGGIGNGTGIPGDDATIPNGDAFGDVCDDDLDNDGIPNASDPDPGGDITYDDNNNGNPCVPLGTDAADDGPSWDSNCNGKRDGVEPTCPLAVNPDGDDDGDGLLNTWEVCKWGTSATVINTDGDTLGDCTEVMDVNGNGFLTAADGTFIKQAFFDLIGKDGDFDINGNGIITNVDAVLVRQAFFGVRPCY
jgi:hypothetical protein